MLAVSGLDASGCGHLRWAYVSRRMGTGLELEG
jgi:hypothetical protein